MTACPATALKLATMTGSAAIVTARSHGCQPNSNTNLTRFMNARPATKAIRHRRTMPIRVGAVTVRTSGYRPPSATPVFQTVMTVMPRKHPPITMPPRVQTATTPTRGQITVLTIPAWQIVSLAIVPHLCTMKVRALHVTIHPIGLMPGLSIRMALVQTATK